jgi:aminoglycoside phosphotransferase (APT) family kinase protein
MNDLAVDRDLAARLIASQFPELNPVRVEHLGEGCDSVAFEVDDAWVFRFPKRADVEHQLLVEMNVLPGLTAAGSPVAVPQFQFKGRPSTEFPHHFGGYRKLPGVTANRCDPSAVSLRPLAPMLGRFLAWLHAFRADTALELGVADQRNQSVLVEAQQEALEDLPILSRADPGASLDAYRTYLQHLPRLAAPSDFALVHNDLAAEHVLVDEPGQRVSGVIDWSDVAVGDRAIDFGGVVHWGGPDFLKDVLSHYGGPVNDGLIARARFFAACRGVLDVQSGIERNRPEYIEAGLRALRMATQMQAGP